MPGLRCAIAALLLSALPLKAEKIDKTWFFAAAACPPWKTVPGDKKATATMAAACAEDVRMIGTALAERFEIPPEQQITLVDADATTQSVTDGLHKLARQVGEKDRVVLYFNTHGGVIDARYRGYNVKDEALVWYTETEPADFSQAVSSGQWMTARTLRDILNQIRALEIVVIIEACNSGFAQVDFAGNISQSRGDGGRGLDWPGREAIIFSASGDQAANFVPDHSAAQFTSHLAQSLTDSSFPTLFDAYEHARLETHRAVRANCSDGHAHSDLLKDWVGYRLICTQMPIEWDPFGLLEEIALP